MAIVSSDPVYHKDSDPTLKPVFAKFDALGTRPLDTGNASAQLNAASGSIEPVRRRTEEIRRGWGVERSKASNAGAGENGGTYRREAEERTIWDPPDYPKWPSKEIWQARSHEDDRRHSVRIVGAQPGKRDSAAGRGGGGTTIGPACSQSACTDHLRDLSVQDRNGEYALEPHSLQGLSEIVRLTGRIDEVLTRDGNLALSSELEARDRFA